jgi:hypothetical protein
MDRFIDFVVHFVMLFRNGLLVVSLQCTHNDKNMQKNVCMGLQMFN